jgi:hypothetical protein
MPKLECKNYNIKFLKILRVYKKFVLKILSARVYRRLMIWWKDIILRNKALGIILKVVELEFFTAVTMKNTVFWHMVPCRSCVNRRFWGTYRLHLQGIKIRERGTSVSRWQQTAAMRVYVVAWFHVEQTYTTPTQKDAHLGAITIAISYDLYPSRIVHEN